MNVRNYNANFASIINDRMVLEIYCQYSSYDIVLYCQVNNDVQSSRLKRFTVPLDEQGEWESANLWRHVRSVLSSNHLLSI